MRAGIITHPDGWTEYISPCSCAYAVDTAQLLGVCHEHQPFAVAALDAADVLLRMRLSVKAHAEAREVAA